MSQAGVVGVHFGAVMRAVSMVDVSAAGTGQDVACLFVPHANTTREGVPAPCCGGSKKMPLLDPALARAAGLK